MKTGSTSNKRNSISRRGRSTSPSGGGGILGMFMDENEDNSEEKLKNQQSQLRKRAPANNNKPRNLPTTVVVHKGSDNKQEDEDDPLDISGLTTTIKSLRVSSHKERRGKRPEREEESPSESTSSSEEESSSSSSSDEEEETPVDSPDDTESEEDESDHESHSDDESDGGTTVDEEIAILNQENKNVRVGILEKEESSESSNDEDDDDGDDDEMSEGDFLEDGAYDPDEETESEGESDALEIDSMDEGDEIRVRRKKKNTPKKALSVDLTGGKNKPNGVSTNKQENTQLRAGRNDEENMLKSINVDTNAGTSVSSNEVDSPRKMMRGTNNNTQSKDDSEEEECVEIYTTDGENMLDSINANTNTSASVSSNEVDSPRKTMRETNNNMQPNDGSEEEGCVEIYTTDDAGFSSDEEEACETTEEPKALLEQETAMDDDDGGENANETTEETDNDEIQATTPYREITLNRRDSIESCAEAEVVAEDGTIPDDASFYVAEALSEENEGEQQPAVESLYSDDNDENYQDHENKADKPSPEPFSDVNQQSNCSFAGVLGERQPASPSLEEKVSIDKPRNKARTTKHSTSVKPGKWSLGSKIGRGAFGVVHVGMNTETGRLMAVKSIKMDSVVMKDLRREIDLLRSLEHDNIVQYYGAQQDKGFLRIFQEWVAGGSVTELLAKFGPFNLDVIRSYLGQMLQGLSYLHRNNIMHRDIKGGNILVTNDGIVKLADFGASKKMAHMQSDLMMSLTIRGTPYYMAPEVFEEKYSYKADLWAVGCVAFQMVTGLPPWKQMGFSNPVSLFNFVKDRNGPPDYELRDGSDSSRAHFKAMLESCFSSIPQQRPTAEELLNHPFFAEEPTFADKSFSDCEIFSPKTPSGRNVVHSPMPSSNRRRNSAGGSPFMSPPLPRSAFKHDPQHRSPVPDMRAWPSWAKRAASERTMGEPKGVETANSLGYTASIDDFAPPTQRHSLSSPLSLRHTANTQGKSPEGLMYLSASTYNS